MSGVGIRIELKKGNIERWMRAQKGNARLNEVLRREGMKVAYRAGPGFTVRTMERRRNRPGVIIYAGDARAQKAQAAENRLGKALGESYR